MNYGISGIKEQKKLEKLPLFNKQTAQILIGKKENNLDKKIQRLLDKNYLISLKKGWYVSEPYLDQQENIDKYLEYITNQLRKPSYLSLEYMLSEYNLILEAINVLTSITIKSTRTYETELAKFVYKNIKKELFKGYQEYIYSEFKIYKATKAKALFDYLYLKKDISNNLKYELNQGLRINWDQFNKTDLEEFSEYVKETKMKKMKKILKVIKEIKNAD